jgi:hypothetical protein
MLSCIDFWPLFIEIFGLTHGPGNSPRAAGAYWEPESCMETPMTLCPIAIVSGCEKCPAFKICPLKGVIGSPPIEKDKKPAAAATVSKKKK